MSLLLHGIDHLSPSGASTLQACERKYWWRYKHEVGKDERNEALAMGHGLAAALEFGDLERGLKDYREARPVLDGWTDPVIYEREGWVAEATIRYAYHGYNARYVDEGLVREQTYLIALGQDDGQFVHYPTRRIVQARVDGAVEGQYLVEDKLRSASSMRADALENEVRQGKQLTAEIWAHRKATDEHLIVKFRVTKKCDPRKWKKLETEVEVSAVIADHFAGDGVFNEFDVTRTDEQLADFEREFTDLAMRADLVLADEEPGGVRNTDACHSYGRVCPALTVCQGQRPWRDLVAEQNQGA
jgi:hypothetical protein